LKEEGLVKTVEFKNPKYVGDPINAVRIFNEKEIDELIFLDIYSTVSKKKVQLDLLARVATECFMPFAYGGGLHCIDDIRRVFEIGAEKIVLNTAVIKEPNLLMKASDIYGNQSIVASIDVKKNIFGKYRTYILGGRLSTGLDPIEHAVSAEAAGAGEIFLNSINRDGLMGGYDINLIKAVSDAVSIPVIACGGAGKESDFAAAVQKGNASAVAAGSMFVFHGKHRAVLINFPSQEKLQSHLYLT
jgi:cyclase